jgi:hypothetical protein
MNRRTLLAAPLLFCFVAALQAADAKKPEAKKPDLAAQLNAAASKAAGERFALTYKFQHGEKLSYRVEHVVKIDTTIEGVRERATSSSVSTKVWKISSVKADGSATFVHEVADVEMRQKVDNRNEVRYNSRTDETPPLQYERVADSVGVPLVEVTIDKFGLVLGRVDKRSSSTWGGQLIMPLPPEAVAIGTKWHKPGEIVVRLPDGRVKRVKQRQQYELTAVDDGIATITVATQLLTPGIKDDPKVMSQIVQKLLNGKVQFDIAAGRILSQQLDLDETVIGFNGPKSIMSYGGRFTEELLPADKQVVSK